MSSEEALKSLCALAMGTFPPGLPSLLSFDARRFDTWRVLDSPRNSRGVESPSAVGVLGPRGSLLSDR